MRWPIPLSGIAMGNLERLADDGLYAYTASRLLNSVNLSYQFYFIHPN